MTAQTSDTDLPRVVQRTSVVPFATLCDWAFSDHRVDVDVAAMLQAQLDGATARDTQVAAFVRECEDVGVVARVAEDTGHPYWVDAVENVNLPPELIVGLFPEAFGTLPKASLPTVHAPPAAVFEHVWRLYTQRSVSARAVALLQNPVLTADQLTRASSLWATHTGALSAIMRNTSTPHELLYSVYQASPEQFAADMLRNPTLPQELFDAVIAGPASHRTTLQFLAVSHPACGEGLLMQASTSPHRMMRIAAARNPNLETAVADTLALSDDAGVAATALAHPATSLEVWAHSDWSTVARRHAVAATVDTQGVLTIPFELLPTAVALTKQWHSSAVELVADVHLVARRHVA